MRTRLAFLLLMLILTDPALQARADPPGDHAPSKDVAETKSPPALSQNIHPQWEESRLSIGPDRNVDRLSLSGTA